MTAAVSSFEHFADFVRHIGEAAAARLRNAPRRGPNPRARRSWLRARRGRRGRPRPARPRPRRAGRRRRGARASAASIWPISPRRCSSNRRGASSRPVRSVCRFREARFERGKLGGSAARAFAPCAALGGDGREPAFGQLDLARERLRFRAQIGEAFAIASGKR